MKRISVVCGAGASSSFLVLWMRRSIDAHQLDAEVTAGSSADITRKMPGLDVVLVARHLEADFSRIDLAATAAGVRAVLLPALTFDAAGAETALSLALTDPAPPPVAPATAAPHTNPGSLHG